MLTKIEELNFTAGTFVTLPDGKTGLVEICTDTNIESKRLVMLSNGFRRWYGSKELKPATRPKLEDVALFEKQLNKGLDVKIK